MKCFLVSNSKAVEAITFKFNTNLPFVVGNLFIKCYKDQPTITQAMARKQTKYLRTTSTSTTTPATPQMTTSKAPYQHMTAFFVVV